ncbi:MAG TPA: GNAT family N-acetyltransferase [Abditibacteriaceae bacterium]|jgi:putative acetyltransferase
MNSEIEIRQIRPDEIADAREVVMQVAYEVFEPPMTYEEAKQLWNQTPHWGDLQELEKNYLGDRATFLVTISQGRVVGTGAIRPLGETVCEVKKMWLLPEFRGRGLGRAMLEKLLEFAREAGYTRARLDTGSSEGQRPAQTLYRSAGFTDIPRYNNGPATVFLEREL